MNHLRGLYRDLCLDQHLNPETNTRPPEPLEPPGTNTGTNTGIYNGIYTRTYIGNYTGPLIYSS